MTTLLQACETALVNLPRWRDAGRRDDQDDAAVERLRAALAMHR